MADWFLKNPKLAIFLAMEARHSAVQDAYFFKKTLYYYNKPKMKHL